MAEKDYACPTEAKHNLRFIIRTLAMMIIIVTSSPLLMRSQYFSLGTDPASLAWKKIRTEHFTIIFPHTLEDRAQYIANGLEHFYGPGSRTLNASPSRFPVILHNQTVVSNAVVPYAPKRIEFLTVPPQDLHTTDWIDNLILHEYRHAVQYTAINTGFTRGLSYVFGQQAAPLMLGLFAPFWFIEGDAVVNETAMSRSGRGRVPSFEMKLRAQFLEKGIYHYDKATHGSFRNFTPDRYELGYQLVGRTRINNGKEVWANALKKSGQLPFMVVPFSYSLKKQTGFGKVKLYRILTDEMLEEWSRQDGLTDYSSYEALNPGVRCYTNYTHPVVLEDGSIITVKKSLDDITRVVHIKEGKEKKLFTAGTGFMDDALSVSHELVCWGERKPDPRWALRSYAVIKTYNLNSGVTRQITRKSRLFAPSINKQGDKIIAVEVSPENQYSLVILDPEDGTEIDRTRTGDNLFFMQPAWSEDGEQVAFVVQGKEGKSIMTWDISANEYQIILPFSHTEISNPAFYKESILFTGAYSGIDNIYAVSLPEGKVYKITSSRFGSTQANANARDNSMVFLDYHSDGYQISRMPLERVSWQLQDLPDEAIFPLAEALAQQEDFVYDPDSVPEKQYPVKEYRKGLNLFNFHSWAPLYFDATHYDIKPGVMLLSQNLLGTSFTTLSWEYDLNEEAGKYSLNYSYEGLYPAIDLGLSYGLRRGLHRDDHDSITRFKYHEWNAFTGVSIPLSWSVRSWYMGVRPGVYHAFKFLKMDPATELQFKKDIIHANYYRIFFYAQQRSAYRDLQPRWGQLLEVNFRHTLFNDSLSANSIFSVASVLYFPGFFKHHGFRIYLGYQDRLEDYYRFPNFISTSRGHAGLFSDNMSALSASYVFPVFYPDWRLGPLFYLKRIKGALFYDHTILMDETAYEHHNTVGLDLSVDFHFLSILAPLEVGLRSMYFPGDGSLGFQFLWGFNIDSLY